MSVIYKDSKGNCYEELDPGNTLPMECYLWLFRGSQKMNDDPLPFNDENVEEMNELVDAYHVQGLYNVAAKFFIKKTFEEECKSPGCKRRMKNVGEPCYWCGK